jgi:hypothetical protein
MQAMQWGLDPWFVAKHTYVIGGTNDDEEKPDDGKDSSKKAKRPGSINYDSALVRSALDASGRLAEEPSYEYEGDWSKVQGRFRMQTGQPKWQGHRPRPYAVPAWTERDEEGLAIICTARLKNWTSPKSLRLEMKQCQPRNSTLWATDPKTQILYRVSARWVNAFCPAVLGGARFSGEEPEIMDEMIDVTPPTGSPPPGNGGGRPRSRRSLDTFVEESAARPERAVRHESTVSGERAVAAESTEVGKRAVLAESTEAKERAVPTEGTGKTERAEKGASTDESERAGLAEGTVAVERAGKDEGAVSGKRLTTIMVEFPGQEPVSYPSGQAARQAIERRARRARDDTDVKWFADMYRIAVSTGLIETIDGIGDALRGLHQQAIARRDRQQSEAPDPGEGGLL